MKTTVECVVTLRLTFDPHMDEDKDIKQRIMDRLNTDIQHGQFEGCEHGAQLLKDKIDISITRIE